MVENGIRGGIYRAVYRNVKTSNSPVKLVTHTHSLTVRECYKGVNRWSSMDSQEI